MDDTTGSQPQLRERVGSHAWVRTVGLVGSGLVAGGTLTATAATDEGTTSTPSVTQEQGTTTEDGTTTDGTTAPEDCPEGAGGSGTSPDGSTDGGSA